MCHLQSYNCWKSDGVYNQRMTCDMTYSRHKYGRVICRCVRSPSEVYDFCYLSCGVASRRVHLITVFIRDFPRFMSPTNSISTAAARTWTIAIHVMAWHGTGRRFFMFVCGNSHNTKPGGLRSGDRGGHSTGSPFPIHWLQFPPLPHFSDTLKICISWLMEIIGNNSAV
jgi:hypothetical protein